MADQLELGDHLCVFVEGTDEATELIIRTVSAGVDAGHKIAVFAGSPVAQAVPAGGLPDGPRAGAGQVQVLPARQMYLPTGRFEPERVLRSLARHTEQAAAEGYRGLRVIGEMSWALANPPGVDRLPRYEEQVTRLCLDGRVLGVCVYEWRRFDRDLLVRVACAHPAAARASAQNLVPGLRIRRTSDPYGLRLVGQIEVGNRPALRVALDAVADEQPDPVVPIVVDLSGLRQVDPAGAALLSRLALRAPAGAQLAGCRRPVYRILQRLGVTGLAGMRVTVADADNDGARSQDTQ